MTLIVNDEKINDDLIKQEADRLRPEYEQAFADMDKQAREEQLMDWSRENIIEQTLLKQQANAQIPNIPSEEIDKVLEQSRKNLSEMDDQTRKRLRTGIESQMKVEKLIEQISAKVKEPNDEQIKDYYHNHRELFRTQEQVRVAHIVKHISWQCDDQAAHEEILQIKNRLDKGELFETLASKHSDCPESAGDLGYIARGQMVEEFEDTAFRLGVNQVSEIIRTRFGYHIVKCYDRKPSVLLGLDNKDVRDAVKRSLTEQMQQEIIEDFIDQLKAQAKIEHL